MKIGIYDPYLDTMSGGERYMLSIASCLQKDHEVFLFWDTAQEEAIRREAERKFAMPLTDVHFTESIFTPNTPLLKRLKESRAYDLIFVLSDGSIPLLWCPSILHFQTPVEWVNPGGIMKWLKEFRIRSVICNSFYTKQYIDAKFSWNSEVLYPPVDLPKEKKAKKEHIILNVGRFGINEAGSSFKKQDVLAEAFKRLQKEGVSGWKLVLIMSGSEKEQEAIEKFTATLKDESIEVIINPDLATVASYYERASIYWHAAGYGEDLEAHPDRAEHFGLATVEAMLRGAVPIVIHAGGQPEIVTDSENGYLWKSIPELLQKTKQVVHDTKLRQHLAEQAEKKARFFGKDHFCSRLSEIVQLAS